MAKTRPLGEQVVVITGASSGIGRETALRLAKKGATVVVSARREDSLDSLVDEIKRDGGEARALPADVSDYKEVAGLVKDTVAVYGRIDTWVNNAGVLIVGEFENTELDEAHRVFNVNFWGEIHGVKAVLPQMKKQGQGTIINVTSVTAKRPLPLMSYYSASKSALNGISEAIQAELASSDVNLCIVMPATIDTPLYQNARTKEGRSPQPAPPIYPPSEVARAIEKCAESPRRVVYAGPAGRAFFLTNLLMPRVADKVLGTLGRQAILSDKPEPDKGEDNLDRPLESAPATTGGGWRTGRYKMFETATRVALGLAAGLIVVRRLTRRHAG